MTQHYLWGNQLGRHAVKLLILSGLLDLQRLRLLLLLDGLQRCRHNSWRNGPRLVLRRPADLLRLALRYHRV